MFYIVATLQYPGLKNNADNVISVLHRTQQLMTHVVQKMVWPILPILTLRLATFAFYFLKMKSWNEQINFTEFRHY